MNVRSLVFTALFVLCPLAGQSQGFGGLGSDVADLYAKPERGLPLDFPKDHGAHPDYRIEWWYVTANLKGADGRDYGLQWTLFRSALAPGEAQGWSSPQIWMGHAGLTTPDAHFVAERLARGGVGQAGVATAPFTAWIDDWHMTSPDAGIDTLSLHATGATFGYDVSLRAEGPLVLQGDAGYSVKSPEGQASYYYSQPFYKVTGKLQLPDGSVEVTGHAWLDREWSSQPLSADQTGWDWVSLHFDDDTRLMGFALRSSKGTTFHSGTIIAADGKATPLRPDQIALSPVRTAQVAGRQLPVSWQVRVPDHAISVQIEALFDGAWMATSLPYWEGPVFISGSHSGTGYLEMTGYE